MRSSRARSCCLAALVLVLVGCRHPQSAISYSPLENVPPRAEQRMKEGSFALWGLASYTGEVIFYLLPPPGQIPEHLKARMGTTALDVEPHSEMGRTYFSWKVNIGKEGITKATFEAPVMVEAAFAGGVKRCLRLPGLGTDSYPVLNMCYFDLPWEGVDCK